MALRWDALVSGVWLVVAAVPPYALPEPSHKEAIDDWIDLIFFVWGLSVAGVFAYLLSRLISRSKGNDKTCG